VCLHVSRVYSVDGRQPCLTHWIDVDCRPVVQNRKKDATFDHVAISQLSISLYLMTQCQVRLPHSVKSLLDILADIIVARRRLGRHRRTLDQLLLKLSEQKILSHLSGANVNVNGNFCCALSFGNE